GRPGGVGGRHDEPRGGGAGDPGIHHVRRPPGGRRRGADARGPAASPDQPPGGRPGEEVRPGRRAHAPRPADPDRRRPGRRPGRRLTAAGGVWWRCHAVAMTVGDAVLAFATAFLVALVLTPDRTSVA